MLSSALVIASDGLMTGLRRQTRPPLYREERSRQWIKGKRYLHCLKCGTVSLPNGSSVLCDKARRCRVGKITGAAASEGTDPDQWLRAGGCR